LLIISIIFFFSFIISFISSICFVCMHFLVVIFVFFLVWNTSPAGACGTVSVGAWPRTAHKTASAARQAATAPTVLHIRIHIRTHVHSHIHVSSSSQGASLFTPSIFRYSFHCLSVTCYHDCYHIGRSAPAAAARVPQHTALARGGVRRSRPPGDDEFLPAAQRMHPPAHRGAGRLIGPCRAGSLRRSPQTDPHTATPHSVCGESAGLPSTGGGSGRLRESAACGRALRLSERRARGTAAVRGARENPTAARHVRVQQHGQAQSAHSAACAHSAGYGGPRPCASDSPPRAAGGSQPPLSQPALPAAALSTCALRTCTRSGERGSARS
jgi:hypothetical protein